MKIKVLGTGCSKCGTLEQLTIDTVKEIGIEATVEKEQDIMKIMEYGVLQTPGLVINDKVVINGRIPSKKELIELITKNQ